MIWLRVKGTRIITVVKEVLAILLGFFADISVAFGRKDPSVGATSVEASTDWLRRKADKHGSNVVEVVFIV